MASSNNPPPRPPRRDEDLDNRDEIPTARRISPVLIGLLATVAALLALIFVVGRQDNSPADDRLSEQQASVGNEQEAADVCTTRATSDLVKRELFRRAAELRGNSQDAYARLAEVAFLRIESPVATGDGSDGASCSGSLILDLPPGVAAPSGRRTLTGEADFQVQGGQVTIARADGIIAPLAALNRTATAAPEPETPVTPDDPLSPMPPEQQPTTGVPQPAPSDASASPSFNCNNARSYGEIAACSDPGIATLDRQMAQQFNSAMAAGGPQEQAILQQTRTRFLRFRDGCRSSDCVADAYRGRMREIRDIMTGDWRPPR